MFARQNQGLAQARNLATMRPGLRRFMRSVSPAAVAVTVSLLIGGAGFADAATGGTFLLGKANTETSTASLSDSKGTPLALSAPPGKAPLAVNRHVMVKNLNAQYLGGMTAKGLAVTGGEWFTAPNTNTHFSFTTPEAVASTQSLRAGTYYVTATASVTIAPGDSNAICWIAKGSAPDTKINWGEVDQEGVFTVAETAAVKVTAGDILQEICLAGGDNGSYAIDAGIVAIRVAFSGE